MPSIDETLIWENDPPFSQLALGGPPLTDRYSLVTVGPGEPVTAAPTAVPAEVPVAAARAVEEPQWPALAVVAPVVGVLGSVAPGVGLNGHALAAAGAGAALVPRQPRGGGAALAALQPRHAHTLPGELGLRWGGAQHHHHHHKAHTPHPTNTHMHTHTHTHTHGGRER